MPKKAITIRVDAALLAAVRRCAADENRTLTNYIETVLKHALLSSRSVAPTVEADLSVAPPLADVPVLMSDNAASAATMIDIEKPVGEA